MRRNEDRVRWGRRTAALRKGLLAAAVCSGVLAAGAVPAAAKSPAICGPGDRPEPGLQGQVPKANQGDDSRQGYWCNLREVGKQNILNRGGNYGHAWIGDCAYVTSAFADEVEPGGTAVLDVRNPRDPKLVKFLTSPGSINAVETIHGREGDGRKVLVAADYDGNFIDVYDASDCRNPKLMSTYETSFNVHNITISYDTKTLWIASALPISDGNQPYPHIVALGLEDLSNPKEVFRGRMDDHLPAGANPTPLGVHRLDVSEDGNRVYAGLISGSVLLPLVKPLLGPEPDVAIFDSSAVQNRGEDGIKFVSQFDGSWHGPRWFKRNGGTYLVSGDEAITNTAPASYCRGPYPTIADITDEQNPKPIGAFELEINKLEHCPDSIEDELLYSTHYTDIDDPRNTRLGLFPMYNAGLRVADLADPANPKEIAYFNPAPGLNTTFGNTYGPQGDKIDLSGSNVRYKADTGHIWFVSMTSGFHVVEFPKTGPDAALGLPPAVAPPAKPGGAAPKCRKSLRVKLPRGLRSAVVYVNGRRVKRLRGRDLRVPVAIRKLPRGRVVVRIVAVKKNGKRVVRSQRYRGC
jgi:hypothetical protein